MCFIGVFVSFDVILFSFVFWKGFFSVLWGAFAFLVYFYCIFFFVLWHFFHYDAFLGAFCDIFAFLAHFWLFFLGLAFFMNVVCNFGFFTFLVCYLVCGFFFLFILEIICIFCCFAFVSISGHFKFWDFLLFCRNFGGDFSFYYFFKLFVTVSTYCILFSFFESFGIVFLFFLLF